MFVLICLAIAMVVIAALVFEAIGFDTATDDDDNNDDNEGVVAPHHFIIDPKWVAVSAGEEGRISPLPYGITLSPTDEDQWEKEVGGVVGFSKRVRGVDEDLEWRDWVWARHKPQRSWKAHRVHQYRA